ncbi:IclR family transcriptional regulator C-terminal domain-containing protein [Streptomyces griseus]|uniref:IclR family transcriptional regulator domain-containing protein n=1 Tax=Streptomyces griseus TaxID=1911 RepID=UPI0004C56305|nr:IclR family transcriptional regulator C-terminal domain-containing protein [Streptomyces griseus]
MATRPVEAVGPLERGLAVLRAVVAGEGGRRGVGEVARETGLARATVDRIATTLTVLGVLRTEGRELLLAPGAAGLGNAYLDSCGLPALLGPHAAALAERLDEPVSLAVPDGDGVRFLAQADRRRALAFAFRPGDLLPAERCAPGALFAADDGRPAGDDGFAARVREARERGVAVDDQLIEPGLVSVALPVRDPAGAVVCAVSVAGHTRRRDAATLESLALAPLRETVAAMETALALGAVPSGEAPVLGAVPPGGTPGPETAPPRETPGPGVVPPGEGAWGAARSGDVLKEELGAGFLRSLARGLDVLRAFGAVRGPARLTDLARLAGLPRATARRSLITLCHLGYVREVPGGFVLLPRVLGLGHALLSALTLPDIATPHLVRLVRTVRESASVAVLDGDDIRYVARVAGSRLLHIDIVVGTRLPAYATSMGRVLLGALPEAERDARLGRIVPEALTPRTLTGPGALREAVAATAERGFGWVEEELEEGLRSVAVPVRDGAGRVVAALNVALGAGRCAPEESLAVLLPQLRETAGRISADLAAVGRHAPVPTA